MSIVNDIYKKQKRSISLGWYNRYGRMSYITIKYSKENGIENKSKHKMLDKKARDWGEIHERKTLYNDNGIMLKWYSGSSHGGYLMLTEEDIGGFIATRSADYNNDRVPEFYLHEYEEDSGWSKLVVEAPEEIRQKILRHWRKDFEDSDRTPSRDLAEIAWESYKRNHLDNSRTLNFKKLIK